jgi:hypothetical protein
MSEKLYQITAPHFVAGLVTEANKVTESAPILGYMAGWYIGRVRSYCERKGWTCAIVN